MSRFVRSGTIRISSLIPALMGFGLGIAYAQPIERPTPLLTGIDAPERFELNRLGNLTLYVGVESQDIDPRAPGEVVVYVTNRAGEVLDVPVLNSLTPQDLVFGHNQVAIEIGFAARSRGERFPVRICARSDTIPGNPCAVVDLFDQGSPLDEPTKNNKELIDLLKKEYPEMGCRCKSGAIRLDPGDANHGSLGAFTDIVGGKQYGEYHLTDKTKSTYTSVYKFEPHFEIEITKPPSKPEGMDAAEWSEVEKLFPLLCPEGQEENHTITFKIGKADQEERPKKVKTATGDKEYPYAETTEPDKLTWDGHGYRETGRSKEPPVDGALKAHEKNIIHWLDAPGLFAKPKDKFENLLPMSQKAYFHSFVHGTTGKDEDSCDCYFGMNTGVVDADGAAQASVLLKKPECK